jgi:hypothetical protein
LKRKLEFKEIEEGVWEIREDDGNVIDTYNDEAASGWPEDLIMRRMIGGIFATAYEAGYARGRKDGRGNN